MGIAIFLRNSELQNHFREILLRSLASNEGDAAIICSGFFQENFSNSNYQVSRDGNLSSVLANSGVSLTTIGIHNANWLASYINFCHSLRASGVNLQAYRSKSFHWHAKIYILKKESKHLLGIIGSSNMTRNAFGLSKPFNYEADVVLWSDTSPLICAMMQEILNQIDDPYSVIRAFEQENATPTIEQRLVQLEKDLQIGKLKKLILE